MADESMPPAPGGFAGEGAPCRPGAAMLPLMVALLLLVVLTVWPAIATDRQGRADHLLALLLLWAMCAGFVRGVGFVPRRRLPRWMLSTGASLLALVLAGLRAACCGQFAVPAGV